MSYSFYINYLTIFIAILLFSTSVKATQEDFEKTTYNLEINENPVGVIEIYSSFAYYYVDPKQLLKKLNIDTEIIDSKGSYRFRLNSFTYKIDPDNKKLLSQSSRELNEFEYIETSDLLLIELNALSKFLKIDLKLNQELKKLNIEKLSLKSKEKQTSFKLKKLNEETISEDNFLVFEIRIDDLAYDQLIDAYQYDIEDKYPVFISLNQFTEVLEFPIIFTKNTAKGWFIDQANNFDLDIKNKSLKIKGKNLKLQGNEFFSYNEEIYILEDKIKDWFPIDYEINFSAQYLKIKPLTLLPFQEKKAREVRRKVLLRYNEQKDYEKLVPDYKLISKPKADITMQLDGRGVGSSSPDYQASYSGFLINETLYHTNEIFFSGDKKQINNFRYEATKISPDKELFGRNISSYSFGDIAAEPTTLVSGSNLGRGAKISTFDVSRPEIFNKKTFEGNIQPNWEVELYRNDQLIDFQVADSTGRYLFQNIDVLYGNNVFRLVFYGPQGEVEEKFETVNIRNDILKKDEYNLLFSANQKGKSVINTENNAQNTLNNLTLKGEYGLTKDYTLSSNLVLDEYLNSNDIKQSSLYQTLSLTKEFGALLNNLDIALNYSDFGYAVRQNTLTNYKKTNISFQQTYFQNYENDNRARAVDPIKWQAGVNLDKVFDFYFLKNIGFSLSAEHSLTEDSVKIRTVTNNLNFIKDGFIYSNNLFYRDISDVKDDLGGNFNIRANKGRGFYRFNLNYDLNTGVEVNSAGITAQKSLFDEYIVRGDINHNFIGQETTFFDGSVNKEFEGFLAGFNFGFDSQSNYNFGLTISFSINDRFYDDYRTSSRSRTNYGSARAFAFLDDDYDNIYDLNEKVLEDIKFRKGNRYIENYDGNMAFANDLSNYDYNEIKIDKLSLADPLWYPTVEGYEVYSRPGSSQDVAFAIHQTSEIEGFVYFQEQNDENEISETANASNDNIDENDENEIAEEYPEYSAYDQQERPISALKLHLVDDEGKFLKTVSSEFDGYFLIEKVVPGKYYLMADNSQLQDLNLIQSNSVMIEVNSEDDFYTDNYIYVNPAK